MLFNIFTNSDIIFYGSSSLFDFWLLVENTPSLIFISLIIYIFIFYAKLRKNFLTYRVREFYEVIDFSNARNELMVEVWPLMTP